MSSPLLDVLKEADLRIGFTNCFQTAATRQAIAPGELQRRLLLCLYGLGTNAGLKRVSAGRLGVTYKELLYTRQRFIQKTSLRQAIAHRGQCDICSQAASDLGRGNDGVCIGLEEVRLVGSEPDDRVAYPLRRPWRHDLLAR